MSNNNVNIPISDAVPAELQQPGPASTENQIATEEAIAAQNAAQIEQENKRRQAEASLANSSPLALGKQFSDSEVLDEMDRLDADRERQAQLDALEEQQQAELLQARVQKRKSDLQRAAERGLVLDRDDELDSLIEREAQESEMYEQQIAAQNAETERRVAEAQTPTEEEIEIAAEPVRQQAANAEAERRQQASDVIRQREVQQFKDKRLEEIDSKIKSINEMRIDPNRFWNQKSTGQKIMAALAMALGAYRQELTGSATNQALDMINKQIETDIELQRENRKLEVDELAALRADYWRSVQNKMDQMKFDSNERLRNAQIQNVYSQIGDRAAKAEAEKQKLVAASALESKLRSGGLTKEDLGRLPKEERERIVVLPDGSLQQATTKEAATETRKFVSETKPGVDALKKLKKMAREGSRLSLEDRARVATLRRTLVGQLRLSLVGPGALTEKEIDIIEDTIGNPNKFVFQDLELAKIDELIGSMDERIQAKYQAAGINPPKSKRQKLIEREMSKGKRSEKEVKNAIDRLIEKGTLSEDYSL